MTGNDQFLIGRHHPNRGPAAGPVNPRLIRRIRHRIDLNPQPTGKAAHLLTHRRRVFAVAAAAGATASNRRASCNCRRVTIRTINRMIGETSHNAAMKSRNVQFIFRQP